MNENDIIVNLFVNELRKEKFVETLKMLINSRYPQDKAEDMCQRVDEAKERGGEIEELYNMCNDFGQRFESLLTKILYKNSSKKGR